MGNLVVLDQKSPGSVIKVPFDFTSLLGTAGVTLTSASTVASVWTGVDAAPQSIVSTTTVAGTVATQVLTGGVAGVIYKLTCSGVTSDFQTVVLYGYLAVVGDPL